MNNAVSAAIQGVPLNYYIWLSTALFVIGVLGVLYRRNIIIIFMCIELMLNAVNLLLVAFSAHHGDGAGQVFVFFIMAVAAAEVAVGLAILIVIYNNTRSTDIKVLNKLKW
ncbi:NADH-quinone oxidoreductase subunit NuoK [Chryseosolibacter indicus]|uniref:NADH-quinone oxidoreductase subunit NuoK n=1 Tax=Chryseosolibacter indicus TaxID=2782351 RepID=UPI0020B1E342|nr:NADH-quinone oxidoreductase subunit NuoK [Chryseosolibacter indicus]